MFIDHLYIFCCEVLEFHVFCPFFKNWVLNFVLICSSWCDSGSQPPVRCVPRVSFQPVACFFTFLMLHFDGGKFLILMKSNISILSSYVWYTLCPIQEIFDPESWKYSSFFFAQNWLFYFPYLGPYPSQINFCVHFEVGIKFSFLFSM